MTRLLESGSIAIMAKSFVLFSLAALWVTIHNIWDVPVDRGLTSSGSTIANRNSKDNSNINETKTLEHYKEEWRNLTQHTYLAQDEETQLDILKAIGPALVLEMEDGREYKCLDLYNKRWQDEQPFSGQPFLHWLDHGHGRHVEDPRCLRERLNRRRYRKFNVTQIDQSRVELKACGGGDGDNKNKVCAVYAATQEPVPAGDWSSVWDLNQTLYLLKDGKFPADDTVPFEYWKVGHCSVTHGRPVLYAGEMGVVASDGVDSDAVNGTNTTTSLRGRVAWINPQSGHYRPGLRHTQAFYWWMRDFFGAEAARNSIQWRPLPRKKYKNVPAPTEEEWQALFQ